MGSYYYLGAQLPYLVYGQDIPMSSEAFKTLARENLSSSDAAVLDYCTLDPCTEAAPKTPSAFINRFREWEKTLRLNLARNRAAKLNRDFNMEVPDFPYDAAVVAKSAMAFESPLEAEIYLDKARWEAIESFQGLGIFNEIAIYAYLLKLLLMERRMAFNTEEGFSEYKALYAAILGLEKQV